MAKYTIGFLDPTDHLPEHAYVYAHSMREAHLMFMGELANGWGFGWDHIQFSDATDLFAPVGCIMLEGKPLYYEISRGDEEPGGKLARWF